MIMRTEYKEDFVEIIPEIWGNDEIMKRIAIDVMIHNPKAFIDSFNRINETEVTLRDRVCREIKKVCRENTNINLTKRDAFSIADHLINEKPIGAIKEVREHTRLGLKESKGIIDVIRGRFADLY
jgi:predicted ribonuclease YlaK